MNPSTRSRHHSVASRQLTEAQWGRVCPIETPENDACGIARSLALGALIAVPSSAHALRAIIRAVIGSASLKTMLAATDSATPTTTMTIMMDGNPVWMVTPVTADAIVTLVRTLRRSLRICPHVGVYQLGQYVHIRTAPGINVRPLIVLDRWLPWLQASMPATLQRQPPSMATALAYGLIEYVDAHEERSCTIAFSYDDLVARSSTFNEQFSHMELEPAFAFGVTAAALPFIGCNPGPRAVFSSAILKQAFTGLVNPYRWQMARYQLFEPQRAMAETRVHQDVDALRWIGLGQMVRIGILATPYTIEDAQEIDESALQAGFMFSCKTRTYISSIRRGGGGGGGGGGSSGSGGAMMHQCRIETFERPPPGCLGMKQTSRYDRLCAIDGLPAIGQHIDGGDIVIGRTYRDTRTMMRRAPGLSSGATTTTVHDDSMAAKSDESGTVEAVLALTRDGGTHQIRKVVVRSMCTSEIGDKFANRYCQKGVCGQRRPCEDSYVSVETGQTLDLIMNPNSLVARGTAGQTNEMYHSMAAAFVGERVDATAFSSDALRQDHIVALARLLQHGMRPIGYERHVNGTTGELTGLVCVGEMHHLKLTHMVAQKAHARNRGPRHALTHQPSVGRAFHGGHRFGGMEVDNSVSLGIPAMLNERITVFSDLCHLPVCRHCYHMAEGDFDTGTGFCRVCMSAQHVRFIRVGRGNALFFQETQNMGMRQQIVTDEYGPRAADVDDIDDDDAMTTTMNTTTNDDDAMTMYAIERMPALNEWEVNRRFGVSIPLTLRTKLATLTACPDPRRPSRPPPSSTSTV